MFQLDYTIAFPAKAEIVYVIGFERQGQFIPIYVGESKRNIGRFGDYVTANFSASTDFKVGRSAKYLNSLGFNVLIKYGETSDRKRDQNTLISSYRASGYSLLNDVAGYHYKFAEKVAEGQRIHAFIDKLVNGMSATKAEDSPSTNARGIEMTPTTDARVRGTSKLYSDGKESLEIHCPKAQAGQLPHDDDRRIVITLVVSGSRFVAGIRSTRDNSYVWICPDLIDHNNQKTNLATVLERNGFRKNQPVRLTVVGKAVEVSAV